MTKQKIRANRTEKREKTVSEDSEEIKKVILSSASVRRIVIENYIVVMDVQDRKYRTFVVSFSPEGGLHFREEKKLSIPIDTCLSPRAIQRQPDDSTLTELFNELKNTQSQYVYFNKAIYYDLAALVTIASYYREVFDTFPYLAFVSPMIGYGKSTATKLVAHTGYLGSFYQSITPSSFFRTVEDSHGIVGIDQLDDALRRKEIGEDLRVMLDAAYQKGGTVPRTETVGDTRVVKRYDAFCLVVYNVRSYVPDDVKSRSIVIPMTKAGKSKRLLGNPLPKHFRNIRDKLYFWRMKHWEKVKASYGYLQEMKVLRDRTEELYLPLLALARLIDDELYSRILEYAKESEQQTVLQIDPVAEALLVDVLPNHPGIAYCKDITESLNEMLVKKGILSTERNSKGEKVIKEPIKPRRVASMIDNFGFKRMGKKERGLAFFIDTEQMMEQVKALKLSSYQEKVRVIGKRRKIRVTK